MRLCKRCSPQAGLEKSKRWEDPETCDRCGQEPVYENKNPHNTTLDDCFESADRIIDFVYDKFYDFGSWGGLLYLYAIFTFHYGEGLLFPLAGILLGALMTVLQLSRKFRYPY